MSRREMEIDESGECAIVEEGLVLLVGNERPFLVYYLFTYLSSK